MCDVGDGNPIHRTENAVVPGLLMFDGLLELYSVLSCEIKYILPVFEGKRLKFTGKLTDWKRGYGVMPTKKMQDM